MGDEDLEPVQILFIVVQEILLIPLATSVTIPFLQFVKSLGSWKSQKQYERHYIKVELENFKIDEDRIIVELAVQY